MKTFMIIAGLIIAGLWINFAFNGPADCPRGSVATAGIASCK